MNDFFRSAFGCIEYFVTITGSIASIISLLTLTFQDKINAIFALFFIIVFLVLLLLRALLFKFKHPSGAIKISTLNKYVTENGKNICYEVRKHIQSKKFVLRHYHHKFKWSGSNEPKIFSDLQEVLLTTRGNNIEYDEIKLKFKKPLFYNEIGLIHLKMDLDDSDNKSKPYLAIKVEEPTKMIQFQCVLKYKPDGYDNKARLYRYKINSPIFSESTIKKVNFDLITKSYDETVYNPDVGYYYVLKWEK